MIRRISCGLQCLVIMFVMLSLIGCKENVEPNPIEHACLESEYINQIMVVGQDKAVLGALIVPSNIAYKEIANIDFPIPLSPLKIVPKLL